MERKKADASGNNFWTETGIRKMRVKEKSDFKPDW